MGEPMLDCGGLIMQCSKGRKPRLRGSAAQQNRPSAQQPLAASSMLQAATHLMASACMHGSVAPLPLCLPLARSSCLRDGMSHLSFDR